MENDAVAAARAGKHAPGSGWKKCAAAAGGSRAPGSASTTARHSIASAPLLMAAVRAANCLLRNGRDFSSSWSEVRGRLRTCSASSGAVEEGGGTGVCPLAPSPSPDPPQSAKVRGHRPPHCCLSKRPTGSSLRAGRTLAEWERQVVVRMPCVDGALARGKLPARGRGMLLIATARSCGVARWKLPGPPRLPHAISHCARMCARDKGSRCPPARKRIQCWTDDGIAAPPPGI